MQGSAQRLPGQLPGQQPMQFMPQGQIVYGGDRADDSLAPPPQANEGSGAQEIQPLHVGGVPQHASASGPTDPDNDVEEASNSFEGKMANSSLKVGEPAYLGWSNVSFTLAPKVVAKSGKDPRYSHHTHV